MADRETFTVRIRRVSDGEERTVPFDLPRGSDPRFDFADHNYACDCNRAILLGDAEAVCGHGGYIVLSVVNESGELLYSESPEDPYRCG